MSSTPTRIQIDAEYSRRRFDRFIDLIQPGLQRVSFHTAVDQELTKFAEHGGFMIIIAPPRHGKSERISRNFPLYLYARDPAAKIIGGSYNRELAKGMSQDVLRTINNNERFKLYYPHIRLARGEKEVFHWKLDTGGACRYAGLDSGVTGFGANWILIDDPIKGQAAADSALIRKKIWDEYVGSFRTRLEPDSKGRCGVLITLTRWHHDDLAGRVLERAEQDPSADRFVCFRFPAVAEKMGAPDRHILDTRAEGEALWSAKYPIPALNALRANSERAWVSLYQGRPSAEGGSVFDVSQLKIWHEPCPEPYAPTPHIVVNRHGADVQLGQIPYPERKIMNTKIVVDCSFKVTPGADMVGIGVWSETDDHKYLLRHMVEERLTAQQTADKVLELVDRFKVGEVGLEDAANAQAVSEILIPVLGKNKIIFLKTGAGKVSRANSVAGLLGQVYLPHPKQYPDTIKLIERLADFPAVRFDDIVDQLTHYLAWIRKETDDGGLALLILNAT